MIKYLILTIALIGIGLSHLEDAKTHLQQSLNYIPGMLISILAFLSPIFLKKFLKIDFLKFYAITTLAFSSFIIIMFLDPNALLLIKYYFQSDLESITNTFAIISLFSISFSAIYSYIENKYKQIISNSKKVFLISTIFWYSASLILTLATSNYSILHFYTMNGLLYTLVNFLLLVPIILYSSLFIASIFSKIKIYGSTLAMLIAPFSMGCPTCGSLIFSIMGIAAGLSIFPLKGLEVKFISLGLIFYFSRSLDLNCCNIKKEVKNKVEIFGKYDNYILISLSILALISVINSLQLSNAITSLNVMQGISLKEVDINKLSSTMQTLEVVFPELKYAKSQEDVISILMPSGKPEYSEALGGISFDNPIGSLNYLSRLWFTLSEDVKKNDPETWNRFISLAAAPRGISCEFCCGVGAQGITSDGRLRCGCSHNPALLAIALGLMKYTNYSDTEILREVMKWKTLWFPKNMIELGLKIATGESPSSQNLPGMVGGC